MLQNVKVIAASNKSDRSLIPGSDDNVNIIPDSTSPTFYFYHLVFTWFQFTLYAHAIHGSALLKLGHLIDPFLYSQPGTKENWVSPRQVLFKSLRGLSSEKFQNFSPLSRRRKGRAQWPAPTTPPSTGALSRHLSFVSSGGLTGPCGCWHQIYWNNKTK